MVNVWSRNRTISVWVKVPYTLFVCVLVPVYWIELGPQNFLWGCDIALFITLVVLWIESRLLASMMAVAMIVPELIWNLDLLLRVTTGQDVIGWNFTGYLFSQERPLLVRSLSLFHVFLAPLLIWLVYRLGYDRRAWWAQTLLTWTVLPLSYLATDPSRNINLVFGIGDTPQTWLPGPWYVVLLMVLWPVLVYIPTHLLLGSLFSNRGRPRRQLR